MDRAGDAVIKQHLIDPEICIRCNTCETMCPVGAISHDANNYVVDAAVCNWCQACIAPCPTGSIDHYRKVPRSRAYSLQDQYGWDVLPPELPPDALHAAPAAAPARPAAAPAAAPAPPEAAARPAAARGATVPPWSAAHPYTQLYGPRAEAKSLTATVAGNVRVTAVGSDYDTHHIVLDFGLRPLPLLEGQSIGIVPPGLDAAGRPHPPRQYSISSPRDGERPGYNNASLTVKRVLQDPEGRPMRGVASNYLCDLKVGDNVQVTGPYGASFLMPNHPGSSIVMICTGTGSAPMRAMTERRRRLRRAATGAPSRAEPGFAGGAGAPGRLLLFFGARTQQELPYFGPLQGLPRDFIEVHFAFSRTPGAPRRLVQDAMREQAATLAPLLTDPGASFYVCGLRAMEEGVLQALHDVAAGAGMDWAAVAEDLRRHGRLHLETY